MTTESNERDRKRDPRPGRSYCNAVTSYECLAPAGVRVGSGFASCSGVRRSDLHTCTYCGEPVCHNCSTVYGDAGRACDLHDEAELLAWLNGAPVAIPPGLTRGDDA